MLYFLEIDKLTLIVDDQALVNLILKSCFVIFHQFRCPFLQPPAPCWTCNRANVKSRLGLTRVISLGNFGEIRTWAVKLFDFYGKWMVPAEISIKLIFLL